MNYNQYQINTNIWQYPGESGWHFITVPKDISDDIRNLFGDRARGWGSLRVTITLGSSTWDTSIFPDKKEGAYILPIKADIRKRENVRMGDTVDFLLEIKVK